MDNNTINSTNNSTINNTNNTCTNANICKIRIT